MLTLLTVVKLKAMCNEHWIHHCVMHVCYCHCGQVDAGHGVVNGRTDADPLVAARKQVMPLLSAGVHAREVLSLPPHLEYDAFAINEGVYIFGQMQDCAIR